MPRSRGALRMLRPQCIVRKSSRRCDVCCLQPQPLRLCRCGLLNPRPARVPPCRTERRAADIQWSKRCCAGAIPTPTHPPLVLNDTPRPSPRTRPRTNRTPAGGAQPSAFALAAAAAQSAQVLDPAPGRACLRGVDETCPVSTGEGTRRVQLVREGRWGSATRVRPNPLAREEPAEP